MSADDDGLRIVDITLPPDKIREFCEQEDNWVLELNEPMLPAELEALYRRQLTTETPYQGLVAELASHTNTPLGVLKDCVARFWASPEVMVGLALSAKCDRRTAARSAQSRARQRPRARASVAAAPRQDHDVKPRGRAATSHSDAQGRCDGGCGVSRSTSYYGDLRRVLWRAYASPLVVSASGDARVSAAPTPNAETVCTATQKRR